MSFALPLSPLEDDMMSVAVSRQLRKIEVTSSQLLWITTQVNAPGFGLIGLMMMKTEQPNVYDGDEV